MRPVIYLMSCALLFNLPLTAKHWHENQKHWDKHSKEADQDDRRVNHHADSCYFQPHDTRVITSYYAANCWPESGATVRRPPRRDAGGCASTTRSGRR